MLSVEPLRNDRRQLALGCGGQHNGSARADLDEVSLPFRFGRLAAGEVRQDDRYTSQAAWWQGSLIDEVLRCASA